MAYVLSNIFITAGEMYEDTTSTPRKTETSTTGTESNDGISGKGSISTSRKSGSSKFMKMDEHGYKITKIATAISPQLFRDYKTYLVEKS
jgi:hypothetical protein